MRSPLAHASAAAINRVFLDVRISRNRCIEGKLVGTIGARDDGPKKIQVIALNRARPPTPLRATSHPKMLDKGAIRKFVKATPRLAASTNAPFINGISLDGNHCMNNGPVAGNIKIKPRLEIARVASKRAKLSIARKLSKETLPSNAPRVIEAFSPIRFTTRLAGIASGMWTRK